MKTLLITLILSTSAMATDLVGITELTVIKAQDVSACSTENLIKSDALYKKREARINAIHDVVVNIAKDLDIDACIVLSMIAQESSFIPSSESKVGAKGLMQVMDSTKASVVADIGKEKMRVYVTMNLESQLTVAELENILVGSTYFKQLVVKFKGNQNTAVIAYNEGPTKIQRLINKGIAFGKKHNHLIKVKENLALLAMN